MEQPVFVEPDDAGGLATAAADTGAGVLAGPLRYPSESGGWQLGNLDLSEHLCRYRDQELVVIIAATGQAEDGPIVCGICGFVMDEVSDCPRCKRTVEDTASGLRQRQEERDTLMDEVDEILKPREDQMRG